MASNKKRKRKKKVRLNYAKLAAAFGVLLFIVAALVFGVLLIFNKKEVKLHLEGDREMNVECGWSYEEPGAKAELTGRFLHFGRKPVDVSISGAVNTSVLGDYEIQYHAEMDGLSADKVRTVHVIDTKEPLITLKTDPDHYTLPGHPYEEEGVLALDNADGDLTSKVVSEEKNGVVYYSVSDSSGNTATAQRRIVYDDRTAPVLTFENTSVLYSLTGQPWSENYTAVDDADGDITDRVTMTGEIDISTPGIYTLTYSVTDSFGNTTKVERVVQVVDEIPVELTGPKVVCLTFDDGPGPYTERLLDILGKYNVKATFFVTDQFPEYRDLIGREYAEGHAVGVHTYTHDFEICYSDTEGYWNDFDQMNDIIEEQTGRRSTIFRFPGGSSNMVSASYCDGIMTTLTQQAVDMGLDYYDWNVLSGDAGDTEDPDVIVDWVITGMEEYDVAVVLLHDIHEYTIESIERIIVYGLENGYTFEKLTPGCYTCHHGVNN